ncbi:MAG: enoyl-CoA hydratase/isomerase family protein, partial [Bacteroidales bacterium]|nr:enoyl-CoA hydratase/isomerase family protein [Bacteroidales bacterium]
MIEVKIENRVCFIEMKNSQKLNCLSSELCGEIRNAMQEAFKNECCAIVLKAECRNGVWSAGHDIHELPLDGQDPLAFNVPMEQLLHDIQDLPVPVIAYVEGTVWGGACDVCLSCDMIVATDNASFAITPAKIGIPYNASGIMHFIRQLGPNKAREMFFTAQPLTAMEALNVGMVNHVATIEELPALLEEKLLNPLRQNS